MYCGERFEKNYCIAKIYWLRCIRRGVICSYKEEKAVSYLSMNVIIQTDWPLVLLSRREQEEASSTSAAKSRHGSSMQTRIIRSRESFELLVDECHHPNGRACGPHEAAANKKRRAWHQQRRADTDLQCSVTFGSLKCRFFEFSLNPKTTQMAQR